MEASHASSPSEQLFQFWSVSFCTCLRRGIEMLIRFGEWGGYFNIALKNSRNEVPTPDMVFCAGVLQDSGNSRAFMAEAWPLKLHNEWVVFSSDFDQSVDYFSYLFDRSLWVNEIGRGWDKLTSCVQDSRFSSGYCGSHQGSQCTGLALKKTQERKLHFHASNLKMMETWTHKAEVSHISWAYPHWTHGVIIRSL